MGCVLTGHYCVDGIIKTTTPYGIRSEIPSAKVSQCLIFHRIRKAGSEYCALRLLQSASKSIRARLERRGGIEFPRRGSILAVPQRHLSGRLVNRDDVVAVRSNRIPPAHHRLVRQAGHRIRQINLTLVPSPVRPDLVLRRPLQHVRRVVPTCNGSRQVRVQLDTIEYSSTGGRRSRCRSLRGRFDCVGADTKPLCRSLKRPNEW